MSKQYNYVVTCVMAAYEGPTLNTRAAGEGPMWVSYCMFMGLPTWAPGGARLHSQFGFHMGSPYGIMMW